MWRKYFFLCVVASVVCWVLFGFDSTWAMMLPYAENALPLLLGQISLAEVKQQSQRYYGTGQHFSAPVIYGTAFIILSLYLERIGIKKSLNFFTTTSFSLMNIGVCEWIYNLLYANLQNQPWTIHFRWKQVTNLTFFTLFIIVGLLTFLYLYTEGYHPNLSKVTALLFVISIEMWGLWVFYPFPIGYITVETTTGTWTNTPFFPQTMYAVDIDPTDGIAVGVPYFVENNLLHTVNLLTKITMTVAILSLCMFKNINMSTQYNIK